MLLTRLELRNFLAYRAPAPIDFSGIGLACLSGPNGAGKSSLLDAVTWALWGNARAHSDDELIRIGQTEMMVALDFEQGGAIYRVIRKRNKGKIIGRGTSQLDFLAFKNNAWNNIGEPSIRETQQRITHLLHLDYETFVNSAFLQQGKADSFTLKTPTERKKILADILGLNIWTHYEGAAKTILQQIEKDLSVLDNRITEFELEEKREPELQHDLVLASAQVEQAIQARTDAEASYDQVKGASERKQAAQLQREAAKHRIERHRQTLAETDAEIGGHQKRIEGYQKTIEAAASIEDGYAQLEQARQLDHELYDRQVQSTDAERRLNDLQRQLDAARAEKEQEAAVYRSTLQQAENTATQAESLAESLEQIEQQISEYEARRLERETLQSEVGTLGGEATGLRTVNQALRGEMATTKSRLDMLQSANGTAACPVCGQPLDHDHKVELLEQFQTEGKLRGDTFRTNEKRLKDIETLLKRHESTLRMIDLDMRQFDMLQKRAGEYRARLSEAQASAQRAAELQIALDDIETVLRNDEYAYDIRAELNQVQIEIEALGYDKAWHAQTRETLRSLNEYERRKRELDLAVESLPNVVLALTTSTERRARFADELDRECALLDETEALLRTLEVDVQEEERRKNDVVQKRKLANKATEDQISIQQQLQAVFNARVRKQELQAKRDAKREEKGIYEQLKEAFGSKGIPAMLIEAAIPELEEASNRLLARITDGRMNIRFDTQRSKKSSDGVIETLDILISDELGTRDYSMYSGGEGFRVNFAIRVALSQFLARRAGAQLQTLFIDEGFGSQDNVGRERLLEAINAISDSFDMILVVTHIDELRDAFPIHIQVVKGADGSSVEVV